MAAATLVRFFARLVRRGSALLASASFVWVAIGLALAIHARSLDIFFHQDDFNFLEGLSTAPGIGHWLLTRHVDHYQIVPKLLYLGFLRLFGLTAVPWHLLMLAVHATNCYLIGRLLLVFPVTAVARNATLLLFAVSTVYHECLYWVAASNVSLCLLFTLLGFSVALRFGRTGDRRVLPLVALCALLGGLCASVAAGAVPVAAAAVWIDGGRTPRAVRRAGSVAAAAAFGTGAWLLLGALDPSGNAKGLVGSALSQFDPVGGAWLTLRSVFERLAGRFFTGLQLPAPIAAAVMLGCLVLAAWRHDRGQRWYWALAMAWVFGFTWLTLSFRTWLGEVVFVSRYQLFPAAGLCLLLALALDNVTAWMRTRQHERLPVLVIAFLMAGVTAVQATAAVVVHRRWRERTAALGQAHVDIRRGLRDAIRAAQADGTGALRLPDLAVGGGEGYRPTLSGMLRYLLAPSEQAMVRFEGSGREAIDPRLQLLVEEIAAGRHNWMVWFDDLSVSTGKCDSASVPAVQIFPFQERGRFVPGGRDGSLRIEPLGQGQPALLRSATPPFTGDTMVLTGLFRATIAGELLLLPVGAPGAADGLGARLRLPPEQDVCLTVDLALAARGRTAAGSPLELRVVNELATYEIGPFVLSSQ